MADRHRVTQLTHRIRIGFSTRGYPLWRCPVESLLDSYEDPRGAFYEPLWIERIRDYVFLELKKRRLVEDLTGLW